MPKPGVDRQFEMDVYSGHSRCQYELLFDVPMVSIYHRSYILNIPMVAVFVPLVPQGIKRVRTTSMEYGCTEYLVELKYYLRGENKTV